MIEYFKLVPVQHSFINSSENSPKLNQTTLIFFLIYKKMP